MHDFCFTIPYGLILGVGGLIGYLRKGSTSSLAGGLGTGFLLILAGYISLKAFGRKKNSYIWIVIPMYSRLLAIGIYLLMALRSVYDFKELWREVMNLVRIIILTMSAGMSEYEMWHVEFYSALMTGFYLFKIATGGNHIPTKAKS
ncbi:hypothetical protein FEM48_Zijuj01G0228900 [Ziziphus jujuba var. spinosa]|uniref:Uncharacterized protein n=1 Tax=Ziziphus jujuba var. spinosa TaxID=714518 RepID=A0A978W411_ZIZJJ|nr:hypothetical protein FEM48_Zijuj01G0228900 [Ziziphus jujuba var. spinosa]